MSTELISNSGEATRSSEKEACLGESCAQREDLKAEIEDRKFKEELKKILLSPSKLKGLIAAWETEDYRQYQSLPQKLKKLLDDAEHDFENSRKKNFQSIVEANFFEITDGIPPILEKFFQEDISNRKIDYSLPEKLLREFSDDDAFLKELIQIYFPDELGIPIIAINYLKKDSIDFLVDTVMPRLDPEKDFALLEKCFDKLGEFSLLEEVSLESITARLQSEKNRHLILRVAQRMRKNHKVPEGYASFFQNKILPKIETEKDRSLFEAGLSDMADSYYVRTKTFRTYQTYKLLKEREQGEINRTQEYLEMDLQNLLQAISENKTDINSLNLKEVTKKWLWGCWDTSTSTEALYSLFVAPDEPSFSNNVPRLLEISRIITNRILEDAMPFQDIEFLEKITSLNLPENRYAIAQFSLSRVFEILSQVKMRSFLDRLSVEQLLPIADPIFTINPQASTLAQEILTERGEERTLEEYTNLKHKELN